MLARAFQDDPAWVWLIPDAERRARVLPWLFRVGFDVTAADVWATAGPCSERRAGCRPGRPAMRVGPTLRALVTTPLRLGAATGPFLSYGAAVEALRAEAMPGAHWYLAGIGVDPAAQRQGIGSALLAARLTAAARDGLPAVLLTNSAAICPSTRDTASRSCARVDTPEDGPHAWAMVRRP